MTTDKLKELALAATEGPWKHIPWHIEEGPPAVRCDGGNGHIVATTASEKDAAFIAAARNGVLNLIRERDEAREARDNEALRGDEVVKMLQAAERERDEAREAVDADEQVIAERDSYHEWADKLAHAIGGLEVGEHSNINNPWHNAIEMAETLHARAEAAEAALSAAQEEVARMRAVMRETSEYLRKLEGNMLANDADMMLDDCLPPSFHADQIDQALTKETPDAG